MMRSAFRLPQIVTFLAAVLLLSPAAVLAQQDEIVIIDEDKPAATENLKPDMSLAPDKEIEAAPNNYQAFYDKWRSCLQSIQSGDEVTAQNGIREILELQKGQSIPRLTEFALSAIRLGQLKLDAKNITLALQYFGIAAQLDPTLPAAFYNQSIAHLKRGVSGVGGALVAAIRGFMAPRDNLRGNAYFNSKIIFLGIATLALAGAAFALVLMIKYNHLLHHDAEEKYSKKTTPATIHLIVWIVLFAPVILFFGVLWLAPFWLMIFVRYARVQERVAAIILIPVFILAGPAFKKAVYDAALLQDPDTSVFYTAFLEGPSPRAIQDLQAHLSSHPDDLDSAVLLASLYERDQVMDQAIDLLQKLMGAYPQDARPANNLASIYFDRGELDYALRLAQKATSLDPGNAVYKFNLSNLYRAKFDFNEANAQMSDARKADPALVDQLERTSHEKVVDVVPTPSLLEKRLRGKTRGFMTFLLTPFTFLGLAFLLGALLRMVKNERRVSAKECLKCGKAFCKKCQPNTKVSGFCIQCLHIFVRKDGVSPASRKEKMEEIEHFSRHQRLFSRIASLILPGSGSLFQDHTSIGLILLLVWFFFVSLLGFTWKYAGSFFFEPIESSKVIPLFCLVSMGILYVGVNVPIPRKAKSS